MNQHWLHTFIKPENNINALIFCILIYEKVIINVCTVDMWSAVTPVQNCMADSSAEYTKHAKSRRCMHIICSFSLSLSLLRKKRALNLWKEDREIIEQLCTLSTALKTCTLFKSTHLLSIIINLSPHPSHSQ